MVGTAGTPLLPLLIFVAEMFVVTLGTLRIIFVARGRRTLAPVLGFFEITIWLFAIGQIMQNLNDFGCFAAYAGGYTAGNFLGILVEQRLAIGTLLVRIITGRDASELLDHLRVCGYGYTVIDGAGATGPVKIVFTIIQRKELAVVRSIVEEFDPKAFFTVDDLHSASQGVFPSSRPTLLSRRWVGKVLPGRAA
jgi:uncharacterized protein YebE (UPF0316 family)